jgi:hypothetical protein
VDGAPLGSAVQCDPLSRSSLSFNSDIRNWNSSFWKGLLHHYDRRFNSRYQIL